MNNHGFICGCGFVSKWEKPQNLRVCPCCFHDRMPHPNVPWSRIVCGWFERGLCPSIRRHTHMGGTQDSPKDTSTNTGFTARSFESGTLPPTFPSICGRLPEDQLPFSMDPLPGAMLGRSVHGMFMAQTASQAIGPSGKKFSGFRSRWPRSASNRRPLQFGGPARHGAPGRFALLCFVLFFLGGTGREGVGGGRT